MLLLRSRRLALCILVLDHDTSTNIIVTIGATLTDCEILVTVNAALLAGNEVGLVTAQAVLAYQFCDLADHMRFQIKGLSFKIVLKCALL